VRRIPELEPAAAWVAAVELVRFSGVFSPVAAASLLPALAAASLLPALAAKAAGA
jgi:hypothetical protein